MGRISTVREINAPASRVFHTVAHISEMSKALPHVESFEYLTEQESGAGTRFRETRSGPNGKPMVTELEVTEYAPNQRVRMVADTHGTIWDTVFEIDPSGTNSCRLTTTMDARSRSIMFKLMFPFIKGMIAKAMGKDMDLVQQHCESSSDEA